MHTAHASALVRVAHTSARLGELRAPRADLITNSPSPSALAGSGLAAESGSALPLSSSRTRSITSCCPAPGEASAVPGSSTGTRRGRPNRGAGVLSCVPGAGDARLQQVLDGCRAAPLPTVALGAGKRGCPAQTHTRAASYLLPWGWGRSKDAGDVGMLGTLGRGGALHSGRATPTETWVLLAGLHIPGPHSSSLKTHTCTSHVLHHCLFGYLGGHGVAGVAPLPLLELPQQGLPRIRRAGARPSFQCECRLLGLLACSPASHNLLHFFLICLVVGSYPLRALSEKLGLRSGARHESGAGQEPGVRHMTSVLHAKLYRNAVVTLSWSVRDQASSDMLLAVGGHGSTTPSPNGQAAGKGNLWI